MPNNLQDILAQMPGIKLDKMKQVLFAMLVLFLSFSSPVSAAQRSKYIISYFKWLRENKENVANDHYQTQDKNYEWELNAHSATTDKISEDGKFYFAFQQESNILLIIDLESGEEKRFNFADYQCGPYCGMDFIYDESSQQLLLDYPDTEQTLEQLKPSLVIINLKTWELIYLDKNLFTNIYHRPKLINDKIVYSYGQSGEIRIVDIKTKEIKSYTSPLKYTSDLTITDEGMVIMVGINNKIETQIIIQDPDFSKPPLVLPTKLPISIINTELAPGVFLMQGNGSLLLVNTLSNSTYTINADLTTGWALNEPPIIKYDSTSGKVIYGYLKSGGGEGIRLELNNYDIKNNSNEQKVIAFKFDQIENGPPLFDVTYDGHLIYMREKQGYILKFNFDPVTNEEVQSNDVTFYFNTQKELFEKGFLVKQNDIDIIEG
jgi:hypothetical protein